MTEDGHRILSARATKIRHRPERVLRRAHRSNSFDDDSFALGEVLQHPTDRWSSDEEDSDAEAEREYQERIKRMRAPPPNATGGTVDEGGTFVPTSGLSVSELRSAYETRLQTVSREVRTLEAKTRKVDAKLKQMNQWRITALKLQEFNPYEMLSYSAVELSEGTKLRYYQTMLNKAVGRNFLRNFKLRKTIKHVHSSVSDLVATYVQGRSGMLHQAEAEAAHEDQLASEHSERTANHTGTPEAYAFQPGRGTFTHMPPAPSYHSPSNAPNSLTGLPSTLPPFAPPQPTLVGSLTDDTVSSAPLSILTAASALPQSERLALQSELQAWLHQSQATIRAGYRKMAPRPTVGGVTIPRAPTDDMDPQDEDLEEPTLTSVPELMAVLGDAGPILRCMIEELLNGYGESQTTLRSFHARTQELQTKEEQATAELGKLAQEQAALERYLELGVSGLTRLLNETREVRALHAEHAKYEARLAKTHAQITQQRARRDMDDRRAARQAALHAAGRSATGGLGVSSTLLNQARTARKHEEEQARIALLHEIIQQQEMAMQSVAASAAAMNQQAIRENNPQYFAAGGRLGTARTTTELTKAEPSTSAAATHLHPPGLEELIALLDSGVPTPFLDQFIERRRKEIQKGLQARGVDHDTAAAAMAINSQTMRSTVSPAQVPTQADAAIQHGRPASAAPARVASSSPPRGAPLRPASAAIARSSHHAPPGTFSYGARAGAPPLHPHRPSTATVRSGPRASSPSPPRHPQQQQQPSGATPWAVAHSADRRQTMSTLLDKLAFQLSATATTTAHPAATGVPQSPTNSTHLHTSHAPHSHPPPPPHSAFIDTLPLAAYPPPPTARPLSVPLLPWPSTSPTAASSSSVGHPPPPAHLYVPTQLIGGLSLASRELQLHRLKNSPYLASSLMTPHEEMAVIDDMSRRAGDAIKTEQRKTSARGSWPLKDNPLAASHTGRLRVGVGASSTRITRQKLAQQKLRLEKQIYEPQLFDGQSY